ncbi:MAG: response regulator [Candidatus Zixiibacteriota bacterium]
MDKYTVLFVDDEPNILRSLKRMFRSESFAIMTADNGRDALDIMNHNNIQVLVTDNLMPEMTGVELLRKVKDISPKTVRIILSGHSDMNAVLNAVNEGEAFRFMLKPWNDLDLKACVSLALAHYKLIESNDLLVKELQEKSRLLDTIRAHHPELFTATQPQDRYTIDDSNETNEMHTDGGNLKVNK